LVGARRVAALGGLGVLAAVAASCAFIVGADDDWQSAIDNLCDCTSLKFLDDDCERHIWRHLEIVSPELRAEWLRSAEAKGCFAVCTNSLECYRTPPACSKDTCNSQDSNECCDGFACDPTSRECVEQ
jgi:hypothetical protein